MSMDFTGLRAFDDSNEDEVCIICGVSLSYRRLRSILPPLDAVDAVDAGHAPDPLLAWLCVACAPFARLRRQVNSGLRSDFYGSWAHWEAQTARLATSPQPWIVDLWDIELYARHWLDGWGDAHENENEGAA